MIIIRLLVYNIIRNNLLFKLITGCAGADRDLTLVPVSVLLQGIKNVLSIRLYQICPGLPQRVDNVVNKPNLKINNV